VTRPHLISKTPYRSAQPDGYERLPFGHHLNQTAVTTHILDSGSGGPPRDDRRNATRGGEGEHRPEITSAAPQRPTDSSMVNDTSTTNPQAALADEGQHRSCGD
jgi:hypothetical protein